MSLAKAILLVLVCGTAYIMLINICGAVESIKEELFRLRETIKSIARMIDDLEDDGK